VRPGTRCEAVEAIDKAVLHRRPVAMQCQLAFASAAASRWFAAQTGRILVSVYICVALG
jgi:hypothetical protein